MTARDDNIRLAAEIATLFLFLTTIISCLCSGYSGATFLITEFDTKNSGNVDWLKGIIATTCFLAPIIMITLTSIGVRYFFVRNRNPAKRQLTEAP